MDLPAKVPDSYSLLREAIRAVPAVKYALGVGGVVAVIAIVIGGLKVDARIAIFGTVIMLVLMSILLIFARAAGRPSASVHRQALVFTWFCLFLFMATATLLFGCVFFGWPLNFRASLFGQQRPTEKQQTITYVGEVQTMKGNEPWGPFTAKLELNINGSLVGGHYWNTGRDNGVVTGKLDGNALDLELVSSVLGGNCRLQGKLDADKSHFDALFDCPDGEHGRVELVATKAK